MVKRILPMPPASAAQQRLTALVVRLRQLTALKVGQTNQARLVTEPDALTTFAPVLGAITAQIRTLEAQIAQAIASYPDIVRREVGIPRDETIVCGMALGYADPDEPANALRPEREPVSAFATFHAA